MSVCKQKRPKFAGEIYAQALSILLLAFLLIGCSHQIKQFTPHASTYQSLEKITLGYMNERSQMFFSFVDSRTLIIIPGVAAWEQINTVENKKRELKSEMRGSSIRSVLSDFNYDAKIKQGILSLLSEKGVKNISEIQNHSGFMRDIVKQELTKENGDAFGLIWPTLRMSAGFEQITLQMVFTLYPIREDLKTLATGSTDENKQKPILKTYSMAQVNLEGATTNIQENALLWAANDGLRIKEALDKALEIVLGDIRLKLNKP